MSIRSALPSIVSAAGFGGVLIRGLSPNRERGGSRLRVGARMLLRDGCAWAAI